MTRRRAVASAAPGEPGEGPETRLASPLFLHSGLHAESGRGTTRQPVALPTVVALPGLFLVVAHLHGCCRRRRPWGADRSALAGIAPGSLGVPRHACSPQKDVARRPGVSPFGGVSGKPRLQAAGAPSWHSRARVVAPAAHPGGNEGDRAATGGARERRRHYAGDRRSDDGGIAARFAGPHPAKREGGFPHPSMPPPGIEPAAGRAQTPPRRLMRSPSPGAVGPVSRLRQPLR